MNKILFLIPLLLLASCSSKGVQQAIDLVNQYADEQQLTTEDVADGLKQALVQGISKGSDLASQTDGYNLNPEIKIPFPADVQKVENALRDIGLGSQVDKFVVRLNRGAEQAAIGAKPIFIDAIKALSFDDAMSILKGGDGAATSYLKKTATPRLRDQFLPVIDKAMNETSATRYYGDLVSRYNKIPFVTKVNADLNAYATDKAIDGLFVMVAKEESNIRVNPLARTTELLKRVFE